MIKNNKGIGGYRDITTVMYSNLSQNELTCVNEKITSFHTT